MLTKYAFFTGSIKSGMENEMRAYVQTELQPLWEQFQPSQKVQVLYGHEQEPGGPTIPLVLAVSYRDEKDMAIAMESSARHTAKAMLPSFYERFFESVELWHYVFKHH